MTGADEKKVHLLAERKGYRLAKVGKGQHRFYIIDVGSGGRMPSHVPDHGYSSLSKKLELGWPLAAMMASRDLPPPAARPTKNMFVAYFSPEADSTAYSFSDAVRSVIAQWRRERPVRTFSGIGLAS